MSFFLFVVLKFVLQFIHTLFVCHRVFTALGTRDDAVNSEFPKTTPAECLVTTLVPLARSAFP